ncbi:MAG: hypothetical protein ACT4NT_04545 [Nitrososphaerota archaeon]
MAQHQINDTVDKTSTLHEIMKAKFATSCISCGDQIARGKEIAKNEQGKWVHKHCAPEQELL